MSRSASTSRTTTRQTKRARTGQDILTLQENSIESNSEVDEDEAPVSFACSQEILRPGDVCSPEIHDALDFDEDTSTADTTSPRSWKEIIILEDESENTEAQRLVQ